MKVKDSTATPEQPLVYDGLFLDDVHITQSKIASDSQQQQFTAKLTYRRYAIDADGNRVYKPEVTEIVIPDVAYQATIDASNGDTSLLDVLNSIATAFAKQVERHEGITTVIS